MRKCALLVLCFLLTTGLALSSEEIPTGKPTLLQRLTSTYRVIANGVHDNLFARTGRYASLPSFKKLVHAVAVHNLEEVKRLVEQYPYLVRVGDNGGSTALLCAAYYGHFNAVRLLLNRRAPVNQGNMFNATPLHAAAYRGYLDVLACLLDHGADPHVLSTSIGTPLHAAAFKGNDTIIRSLLRAGADPEALDTKGRTSLHHALMAKQFNWRAVLILVKASEAATDMADIDCRTPIGYALKCGRGWGLVEFLLERGARVTVEDMIASPNGTSMSLDVRAINRMKTIRKDGLKNYYKELKRVTHFSEQGLNLLILTFTFYDCPSIAELQDN